MHPVTESPALSGLAEAPPPAAPVPATTTDEAPKVPDMVALNDGPMTETAGLELALQSATDGVLAFAYLALWWHQSGRPELTGGGAPTLRATLAHVAEAALKGGVHEACRALCLMPPTGAWWSFGPFDAPHAEQPTARVTGLDTVLADAARELAEVREDRSTVDTLLRDLEDEVLRIQGLEDSERLAALGQLAQVLQAERARDGETELEAAETEEAPTLSLVPASPSAVA